jgi:hypothetical protein
MLVDVMHAGKVCPDFVQSMQSLLLSDCCQPLAWAPCFVGPVKDACFEPSLITHALVPEHSGTIYIYA